MRVPQVKPDRGRRRGAELPGAAAQRVGERPGEVLRLQVPPLVVGEDQGVIPGQLQRHGAARILGATTIWLIRHRHIDQGSGG